MGEHEINYHPRVSIKGHTLENFLLEILGELQQEMKDITQREHPKDNNDQ